MFWKSRDLIEVAVHELLMQFYGKQEEAAGYYHIGENKLRSLIDEHPHENFYVMNGNRVLIKRVKFEEYLDQATAV